MIGKKIILTERKMMKRIAVITMHAVKNYGSVLQTLATQRLFELHTSCE